MEIQKKHSNSINKSFYYKTDYNSVVISENVVEVINKLKQEPGDDLSLSGATLAETCIRHGQLISGSGKSPTWEKGTAQK